MTNNDILILAKAGFTAAQIAALNAVREPVKDAEPEQPAQKPAEEQQLDQLLEAINGLGNKIQTSNLQAAQQPVQPVTVDNILANIINPPEIMPKE